MLPLLLLGPGGKVLVLEKKGQVGGAAVTEEIVPGFKFSRASYLAGLIRPSIVKELDLHNVGFPNLALLLLLLLLPRLMNPPV